MAIARNGHTSLQVETPERHMDGCREPEFLLDTPYAQRFDG